MIKVGTRVAFSRKFLRSISAFTGWQPFARGEVTKLESFPEFSLATIAWDDGHVSNVLSTNLVREDRLHLEPV